MTMSRRRFVQHVTASATIGGMGSLGFVAAVAGEQRPNGKSRIVSIDAKPEPISFDPARTAIVVVDMQNDFGTKGGMLERAGVDISMIQRAVAPTARALAAGRAAGIKVVYLKMAYRPDLSDLAPADSPLRARRLRLGIGETVRAPNGTEGRILIRDTWNTDILSELTPKAGDIVLYKHRFSGFYETELDALSSGMGSSVSSSRGARPACVSSRRSGTRRSGTIRACSSRTVRVRRWETTCREPTTMPRSSSFNRGSGGYRDRRNSYVLSQESPRRALDNRSRDAGWQQCRSQVRILRGAPTSDYRVWWRAISSAVSPRNFAALP